MTRGSNEPGPLRRKRSIAWIYYALLAVAGGIAGFHAPAVFVLALALAVYSAYLFRGGRFVLWIW